jgi:FAD-dependent oxidoreductase domain-containing protein 1
MTSLKSSTIHFCQNILKFYLVTQSLYYHPSQVGRLAGIGSGAAELSVPLPVEKRKRFVYVPHCPGGPGLDCPLVVDPTGVYFRQCCCQLAEIAAV